MADRLLLAPADEPQDDLLGIHDKDDERLDDLDDVLRHLRLELHRSRASGKRSKEQRGRNDTQRVVLGQQRDRDAREPEAR